MDFIGLVPDGVLNLLGEAAKAELTQNLIVFGVMWRIIKKTVNGHFVSLETTLQRVATGLENLETAHTKRIQLVEDDVKVLKQKVGG